MTGMSRSADDGPTSPFPRLDQANVVLSSLNLWRQLTKIQMLKQSIPTPIGRSGQAARVPGRMWWSRRCCCKGQDSDWSNSLDDGSVLPCACPVPALGHCPNAYGPHSLLSNLTMSFQQMASGSQVIFSNSRVNPSIWTVTACTFPFKASLCRRMLQCDNKSWPRPRLLAKGLSTMKRMLRAAAGFADLISRLVDV